MTTKSESNDELSENSELRAVKRLYELTIRNLYVQCNIPSRLENAFLTFFGLCELHRTSSFSLCR